MLATAFQKSPVRGQTSTRSDRGMEAVDDACMSAALLNVERQPFGNQRNGGSLGGATAATRSARTTARLLKPFAN